MTDEYSEGGSVAPRRDRADEDDADEDILV
jgi:hypothetical protein